MFVVWFGCSNNREDIFRFGSPLAVEECFRVVLTRVWLVTGTGAVVCWRQCRVESSCSTSVSVVSIVCIGPTGVMSTATAFP